ncbi:hypothetical protein NAEGRDRAFT_81947 [Naegleria gruberi]|uniref:Uncharacterized protein n=1 Tax=Naegleria gruberi TaxID=5762 RepID=D2W0P5_NAEGR|nr:uncharacterized protein NAEGRDRAFT_81947 [Naegleria gruberi]EFC37327.1 hypothetical protein NAEGRDRAFT_81947 [Naegleria gruberi]|eukprot:XP_002670071.1 hypothetical protein NAEGRDRAFT_81947 [Naegleria gruberi strain NEG-M]
MAVRLLLSDFTDRDHHYDFTLENMLTRKLMFRFDLKLIPKSFICPFSTKRSSSINDFNLNNTELKFKKPVDVKFSPQFQCLIISDENGLYFLNHKNASLMKFVAGKDFGSLCVDYCASDCGKSKDYLIVTTQFITTQIRKYDLEKILFHFNDQLWRSGFEWSNSQLCRMSGIAFSRRNAKSGSLFVSDWTYCYMLNAGNGKVVTRFHIFDSSLQYEMRRPIHGIEFYKGNLWLVETTNDICHIHQFKWENSKWNNFKIHQFKCKGATCRDIKVINEKYLAISDSKGRILLFDLVDFKFLRKSQITSQDKITMDVGLQGICFNPLLNEMYACDFETDKVHIIL